MANVTMTVNGRSVSKTVEDRTLLVDFLRESTPVDYHDCHGAQGLGFGGVLFFYLHALRDSPLHDFGCLCLHYSIPRSQPISS